MRSSLFWKLTASFALAILIGIGGALLVVGYSTEAAFERYAHGAGLAQEGTVATLARYYAARGTWEGVQEALEQGRGRGHRQGGGPWPVVRLADANGIIQVDPNPEKVGRPASAAELRNGTPITVRGERVGTLLVPSSPALDDNQQAFLGRMRGLLFLSGGAALLVALVLGAALVRGVTRPLNQLTAASRAVAAGRLETRVEVRSQDEVGELATAFNHMAADLARAEEARRQQTADIAHELRTPLTVIQGHLEAFADGIFPPDEEHLEPVLEQAQLLSRLVEDLRTLSLADAGRLTLHIAPADPASLLARVEGSFRALAADRQIDLILESESDLPEVAADAERVTQVLGNLISNALRHTPPGGRVTVGAARQDAEIHFSVRDTGPGVPPEQLPQLFKRFWRGDSSRSRRTGGSGLGLAIARRIVEGHGGRIWARNAPEGGLAVSFSLPLAEGDHSHQT